MHRTASTLGVALAASALGWSTAPAHAVRDPGDDRLVGGGWVAVGDAERDRARLGVQLPCPGDDAGVGARPDPPGRLQVSWGQRTFHLDAVTSASCSDGAYQGSGTGRCGEEVGIIINMRFVDGGRAGLGGPDTRPDTVELGLDDPRGACTLLLTGPLGGGNISMVAPAEGE